MKLDSSRSDRAIEGFWHNLNWLNKCFYTTESPEDFQAYSWVKLLVIR